MHSHLRKGRVPGVGQGAQARVLEPVQGRGQHPRGQVHQPGDAEALHDNHAGARPQGCPLQPRPETERQAAGARGAAAPPPAVPHRASADAAPGAGAPLRRGAGDADALRARGRDPGRRSRAPLRRRRGGRRTLRHLPRGARRLPAHLQPDPRAARGRRSRAASVHCQRSRQEGRGCHPKRGPRERRARRAGRRAAGEDADRRLGCRCRPSGRGSRALPPAADGSPSARGCLPPRPDLGCSRRIRGSSGAVP
mmetsp:Transcript_31569/g.75036  ORF Transcript_31569/g.75036 Transcript_31569/m.75036 type:complete len:252 (+) Transcript_31569:441-1196(+)